MSMSFLAKLRKRGDESSYQELELFDKDRNPIDIDFPKPWYRLWTPEPLVTPTDLAPVVRQEAPHMASIVADFDVDPTWDGGTFATLPQFEALGGYNPFTPIWSVFFIIARQTSDGAWHVSLGALDGGSDMNLLDPGPLIGSVSGTIKMAMSFTYTIGSPGMTDPPDLGSYTDPEDPPPQFF